MFFVFVSYVQGHWNRILETGGMTPEFARIKSQIADIQDIMVDNIGKQHAD